MKIGEFFSDSNGVGSMSRALLCGAFLGSTAIMFHLAFKGAMTEGYMTLYLGTFASVAITSKAIDERTFGNKAQADPTITVVAQSDKTPPG